MLPLAVVPVGLVALCATAVFVAALLCMLVLIVRSVERKLIFPGAHVDSYRRIHLDGFVLLPSGNALYHHSKGSDVESPVHRKVLFLHGNAGSLDMYTELLEDLHLRGYNVYAMEYLGYGMCTSTGRETDYANRLLDGLVECWTAMDADPSTIVISFSLGGGIMGATYHRLDPHPAQLVFVNTFCDLRQLVRDMIPLGLGGLVAPMMKTSWTNRPPTSDWASTLVTIISTDDDMLIPFHHSLELVRQFSSVCSTTHIRLPDGGHALSLLRYFRSLFEPSSCILSPFR